LPPSTKTTEELKPLLSGVSSARTHKLEDIKETLSPYKTTKSPTSNPGKTSSTTETPRERRVTL